MNTIPAVAERAATYCEMIGLGKSPDLEHGFDLMLELLEVDPMAGHVADTDPAKQATTYHFQIQCYLIDNSRH